MIDKFKVYSSIDTAKSSNDGDKLSLTGLASSMSIDSYNESMSQKAIESMQRDAVGLNILKDHTYTLDSIIGKITDSYITENRELMIDFDILPSARKEIQEYIDNDIALSLSIGGTCTGYDHDNNIIEDIALKEVSLVCLPANWDSFNSVRTKGDTVHSDSFSQAIHEIKKSMESEKLSNEEIIDIPVDEVKEDVSVDEVKEETVDETKATEEHFDEVASEEAEPEYATLSDVVDIVNEAFAEKEKTMTESIIDELKAFLSTMKADDEEEEDEEEEEKPEEEENTEEEEEDKEEEKSLDVDALADKVAAKVFESLSESKKEFKSDNVEEPVEKEKEAVPFTSKEAAKYIIADMEKKDPLSIALKDVL